MAVDSVTLDRQTGHRAPGAAALKRVLDITGNVVSVLIAVFGSLMLVLAVATHFAPASFTVFGHPMYVVLSGSMTPTIDTGDIVIDEHLTAQQAQQLHVGQIITFTPQAGSGLSFTHRIQRLTTVDGQVAYVTKGDANNAPDAAPVLPAQILGLYDARIPDGGYIMSALRQPLTLALLMAAPILWLLSGLLFDLARKEETAAAEMPPTAPGDAGSRER